MGQRFDVVALGELVIDLVPEHTPGCRMAFAPKPGGAPGNVAVGVARLGGRAAMLSKVGDDAFGRLLIETLRDAGVSADLSPLLGQPCHELPHRIARHRTPPEASGPTEPTAPIQTVPVSGQAPEREADFPSAPIVVDGMRTRTVTE